MTARGGQCSRDQARAAKAQATERLAELPGVVGIGLEKQPDGGWCVRVNVTSAEVAEAVAERLPGETQAAPVRVRVTGTVHASSDPPEG
ncbi:hypothetical protein [Ruania zhangjianzhongii]|uniref:hypothetical protein n=1 Tax=Ruania zhangjianzhongii TaxID=2603206 RepID=UPI0011C87A89|nr:hypothetical protein [Ruania zhangjianzhongii]